MSPNHQPTTAKNPDRDWQCFQQLLTLWRAENPIKTIKLQFLLASNTLLLGMLQINGGVVRENLLLLIGGAILCIVWTLSIGRTSLFQKAWKLKLDEIAQRNPDDERFQILDKKAAEHLAPVWLQILGGVSSRYYLLGAPLGFAMAWLLGVIVVS